MGDRQCGELVGRGAVLRPWDDFGQTAPLPFEVRWRVVQDMRMAKLDRRFLATIVHWPALIESFMSRATERAHSLAAIASDGSFSGSTGHGNQKVVMTGRFTGTGTTAVLRFMAPSGILNQPCHTPQLKLKKQ